MAPVPASAEPWVAPIVKVHCPGVAAATVLERSTGMVWPSSVTVPSMTSLPSRTTSLMLPVISTPGPGRNRKTPPGSIPIKTTQGFSSPSFTETDPRPSLPTTTRIEPLVAKVPPSTAAEYSPAKDARESCGSDEVARPGMAVNARMTAASGGTPCFIMLAITEKRRRGQARIHAARGSADALAHCFPEAPRYTAPP